MGQYIFASDKPITGSASVNWKDWFQELNARDDSLKWMFTGDEKPPVDPITQFEQETSALEQGWTMMRNG